MNYYNEFDAYAAQWLRNLIAEKLIPAGDVDERDIRKVQASDLKGYTQCHFFAGIGGWPLALSLAGWREDEEVWTGSCPCQPFSQAGKRKGRADERHLWPAFFGLIRQRHPLCVFGEQVAGPDGLEWLDGVRADLEDVGYACGAANLCAAGVGAPHIRQRLYWVADADGGIAGDGGVQRGRKHRQQQEDGGAGGMAHAENAIGRGMPQEPASSQVGGSSPWSRHALIPCSDGKARRIPLAGDVGVADGISAVGSVKKRSQKLRGFGNAIVPQVAAEFVMAYCEARDTRKENGK